MSKDSAYKQGASDANKNLGPRSDSSFKTSQEREAYNAGYNQNKK